jgi:hypothetical protein
MTTLEAMKKALLGLRAPDSALPASKKKENSMEELIRSLRKQEKEDQAFILKRRIVPLAAGIVIFTVILIFLPVRNPVMGAGCFLISASLLTALILCFIDYMDISKESYDSSVHDFLRQKEKRLRYWRTTPLRYHFIYICYVAGVVMISLGNSAMMSESGGVVISIYLGAVVFLLGLSWILGARRFRKRHREKHRPLLELIEELEQELAEEA